MPTVAAEVSSSADCAAAAVTCTDPVGAKPDPSAEAPSEVTAPFEL